MSFYINNNNPNKPGPISGNAVNGICEKILIETTKVFDACVCTSTESGIILPITVSSDAVLPVTYVSAENTPNATQTISDLVIDRLDSCPNYANVSFTISMPVTVTYRDSVSTVRTATSTLSVQKSVILFVPQPAITPVNVTAVGSFSSSIGTFTSANIVTVTGCIQIIVKVISTVDVLVPSYGYPVLPPCQQSPGATICNGLQDLPIYPTASTITTLPRV